jgi:hypothetical protein
VVRARRLGLPRPAQGLATLFEHQREGVVTGLNNVVAVDERVFVEVTGPRLEEWGLPGGQACMVVTIRDGRIVRMQDYRDRAAARAGAGLPPEPQPDAEAEADQVIAGEPPRLWRESPLAHRVTDVIRSGDAAALRRLLDEHPELADTRIDDPRCRQSRTLLHIVTDWPGNVPEAAAKIRALVAAGADVNARFSGSHSETPLHWAASSDDVEALDVLLDAGADIEADGAVIGGGTPMADAVAFGQWKAARRLLERGARTNLWQAAASASATASATSSPVLRQPAKTSTTRCGAPPTADSATPPRCSSTAAPTPTGWATTTSPPPKPPHAAARTNSPPGWPHSPDRQRDPPDRRGAVLSTLARPTPDGLRCARTPSDRADPRHAASARHSCLDEEQQSRRRAGALRSLVHPTRSCPTPTVGR